MTKADGGGMQEVPFQRFLFDTVNPQLGWRAVERIAHHGVANRRKVYTNLMSAPGARMNVEQREMLEAPPHLIMRLCFAGANPSRPHSNAPARIAAHGLADFALISYHTPVNKRQVGLVNLAALE